MFSRPPRNPGRAGSLWRRTSGPGELVLPWTDALGPFFVFVFGGDTVDTSSVTSEEVVSAWLSLPRRIYLDTCTLQAVHDYGDVIWEGEAFVPRGRAGRVEGYEQDLEALRMIFTVNERAMFEFVVTESTLLEVRCRNDRWYTQWVRDVQDTWLIQCEGEPIRPWGHRIYNPTFGMISKKDCIVLQDALDLGCDAFLTMEKKLPKSAGHVERLTGLRILRPTEYRKLLAPWARLYR